MAIYRFRIEIEDHEDSFREIDVKSTQTFEDLHFSILKSFGFDFKHDASFFFSDDLWHQLEEIAYKNINFEVTSNAEPMNKAKLADFIEDPHQRFTYLYDFEANWVFLIELMGIEGDYTSPTGFPVLHKSVGESPKQYKKRILFNGKKEETASFFEDEDGISDDELGLIPSLDSEMSKDDLSLDLDDDLAMDSDTTSDKDDDFDDDEADEIADDSSDDDDY